MTTRLLPEPDLRAKIERLEAETLGNASGGERQKISFGKGKITFTKGKASTNLVKIKHELGVVPKSIQLTLANLGSIAAIYYGGVTETEFEVQAFGNEVVEGEFDFSWIAIG